jgi:RNA polymerase sigma-70 factor (ECF subfamily)
VVTVARRSHGVDGEQTGVRLHGFVASASADDERIRALYQAHSAAIRGYLMSLTHRDSDAAEDILQETLVRAWRHLDTLVLDVESLRPWLLTVARRLAIDHYRADRARPVRATHADISLIPADEDEIDRLLTTLAVRRALCRLSPAHRAVVYHLFYRGHTVAEAAVLLGVPEGTVKSRAYYAQQALRASASRLVNHHGRAHRISVATASFASRAA